MAKVVSMLLAEQHIKQDNVDAEAELVEIYLEAAESYVEKYLRRPLVPWDDADRAVLAPACVKAAILLVLGDLYENRSANVEKPLTVNKTLAALLAPHRVYNK